MHNTPSTTCQAPYASSNILSTIYQAQMPTKYHIRNTLCTIFCAHSIHTTVPILCTIFYAQYAMHYSVGYSIQYSVHFPAAPRLGHDDIIHVDEPGEDPPGVAEPHDLRGVRVEHRGVRERVLRERAHEADGACSRRVLGAP